MAENDNALVGRITIDGDEFVREMSEALARYQRDMAFTAPELWPMRLEQLRSNLIIAVTRSAGLDDDEEWPALTGAFDNDVTRRLEPFSVREAELEERAGNE